MDIDERLLVNLIRCAKKLETAVAKLDPPADEYKVTLLQFGKGTLCSPAR